MRHAKPRTPPRPAPSPAIGAHQRTALRRGVGGPGGAALDGVSSSDRASTSNGVTGAAAAHGAASGSGAASSSAAAAGAAAPGVARRSVLAGARTSSVFSAGSDTNTATFTVPDAAASVPQESSESARTAGLGRSSALMASGTAVSRVLGLVRNILLVAAIGTTGLAADAFDIANKIPNVLFAILAGGVLNAVLVPQIMKAFRSANPQERLDKLLTLSGSILLGISVILTLGSSIVVALYAGDDWTAGQISLAVAFAFWCTPQLFFYGLYTLLGQVLNAREQFGPFMWAPVLNNIVSIIGFGAFIAIYGKAATGHVNDLAGWDGPKIALMGATATLGVAAQALILFVPLWRSGFRWNIRFGYRNIGLRSAGKVAGFTFAAVILEQLGVLFTTRLCANAPAAQLAATFGEYKADIGATGQVSGLMAGAPDAFSVAGNAAYTQALMIYLLPHSLVTISIATALFTGMSAAARDGKVDQVRADLSRGVRTIGVFTVFATAVLVILAEPLTKLLVPTVTPASGLAVSRVLVAMAFGLVPLGGMVLMKWVYFAYEDGATVFYLQVIGTVALVGVAWIASRLLDPPWWVVGVGIAMSVANVVAVIGRTAGLRQKLSGLDGYRILRFYVRATLAAVAAAAAGWFLLRFFGDLYAITFVRAAIITAVVGIAMTGVYLGGLRLLRVTELSDLVAPFTRRLRRR